MCRRWRSSGVPFLFGFLFLSFFPLSTVHCIVFVCAAGGLDAAACRVYCLGWAINTHATQIQHTVMCLRTATPKRTRFRLVWSPLLGFRHGRSVGAGKRRFRMPEPAVFDDRIPSGYSQMPGFVCGLIAPTGCTDLVAGKKERKKKAGWEGQAGPERACLGPSRAIRPGHGQDETRAGRVGLTGRKSGVGRPAAGT